MATGHGTPDWLDTAYKRLYISQHYEDFDERFFSRYDPARIAEQLDELAPELVIVGARTINGFTFGRPEWDGYHRRLRGVDQLEFITDYCRTRGVRTGAYVSTVYDKRAFGLHPEWRQIGPDGDTLRGRGLDDFVLCPNSPYRDLIVGFIERLFSTYRFDCVFFDNVTLEEKACYCAGCRRAFHRRHGHELPGADDADADRRRAFARFRSETITSFARDIYDAVKRVSPDTAVTNQYVLLRSSKRIACQTVELGAVPDYPFTETGPVHGLLGASVVTRICRSVGRGRPEVGVIGRTHNHNDAPARKPLPHLEAEAFTVLAGGGVPLLFDIMWTDGTLQDAMLRRFREVFDGIDERRPWLGGQPRGEVAVLYSESTRFWYDGQGEADLYDPGFYGACRTLIEEHLLFRLITRATPETLAGCRALLVPDAACMGEDEVRAIRDFVLSGGGLVFTGRSSLFDEDGRSRSDFALGDVSGVRWSGDTSAYTRVFTRYEESAPFARRLPDDRLVNEWGIVSMIQPLESVDPPARVAGRLALPLLEPDRHRFAGILGNPPVAERESPVCVVRSCGAGRVVQFGGTPERGFMEHGYPELRAVLTDAVRHVLDDRFAFIVRAPTCVEVSAFDRDGDVVVHLVNAQTDSGREAAGRRRVIEEIVPVHDVEVTIDPALLGRELGARPSVTLQPGARELTPETDGALLRVALPPLGVHAMLVVSSR